MLKLVGTKSGIIWVLSVIYEHNQRYIIALFHVPLSVLFRIALPVILLETDHSAMRNVHLQL